MKLHLSDAKIVSGSIGTGKAAFLTATVAAGFHIGAAEALECRDELFDGDNQPRRFSYHGLSTSIPAARVLFRSDKKQKAREFSCEANGFEIEQKDGDSTLRVKLTFVGEKKIEAYALLFGGEMAAAFSEVTIEGTQAEIEFEPEPEVAHA